MKLALPRIADVVENRLCQGCGACAYACQEQAIELHNFVEVGIRPIVDQEKCSDCGDCISVCSGIDLQRKQDSWPTEIMPELSTEWGPVIELWEGHASDEEIRFKGGSGGAATALAAYCLEQEGMAGALHVGMDSQRPYLNQTIMSRSRAELTERTGSRYAPAAVCAELGAIADASAPCVMIAKPCDIAAAQKARSIRHDLDRNLGLTISIFCGGTPSTQGTLEILKQLGVDKDQIGDLRYRGYGWPGMTGVNLRMAEDGQRIEMTYHQAWDTILTKHKPFRCHICPDGTGEFADISCGDPWYRPIQKGEYGSTLIVVRTERGRQFLQRAMKSNYITARQVEASTLPESQISLRLRRRHVLPKLFALWLLLLPYPRFSGLSLWRGWLQLPWRRKLVSIRRGMSNALNFRRSGPLKLGKGEPIAKLPPVQMEREA